MLFGDFDLNLWSRTIWSWTINNLREFSKSNMLQDHVGMHTTPGACLLYAPGAVCISNMVLEHI